MSKPTSNKPSLAAALLVFLAANIFAAVGALAQPPAPFGMAGKLIEHYHMQKVPQEGCWFSLSYSSDDALDGDTLPARYAGRTHAAGNAIVALETAKDFSALHRLQTDEVWHFYEGSPIDLLLLYPDGHGEKVTLGANVLAGELRQFTVPRGVWQGSSPRDRSAAAYSLFADQLSPGFDYADFEIGYRDALQRQYPTFARDIEHLTRAEFAVSPAASSRTASSGDSANSGAATDPRLRRPNAFSESDAAAQTVSPGVTLKELVGQKSPPALTSRLSVARFTLAPGHSSGTSYNHRSEEVFLVVSGTGYVHLWADTKPVGPGSTVFIPATVPHSIEADTGNDLVFLAISAPAFTPDDYVLVPH
jgi:predicted cupin superfamily sugar epimerase/quercetin dioxygenase-like cupin family protein